MDTATLSADDFFWARDYVSTLLGRNSQTQKPTRDKQAEVLLRSGIVDIKVVLDNRPRTDEGNLVGRPQEEQEEGK